MPTQKQLDANRRNAAKSTGPRTAVGKARSSRNALTHGLTAQHLTIPGEDATQFEALHASYRATYEPQDNVEEDLVHEMAIHRWRLMRYFRMETGLLWELYSDAAEHMEDYPPKRIKPTSEEDIHTFRMGKVTRSCSGDTDRFRSLSRHEAAIERGFQRTIKTLEMRRNTMAARARCAPKKDDYETNPIDGEPVLNQQSTPRIKPRRAVLEPNPNAATLPETPNPAPHSARLSINSTDSTDVP